MDLRVAGKFVFLESVEALLEGAKRPLPRTSHFSLLCDPSPLNAAEVSSNMAAFKGVGSTADSGTEQHHRT